jgi:hypothetical protein
MSAGPPDGPTCPVVSAFSELKQFSDYPKCPGSSCAWYDGYNSQCAVLSVARMLDSSSDELRRLLDELGWDAKQNIQEILRGVADLFKTNSGLFSDLTNLVRHYSDRARRIEQSRGGQWGSYG